MGKTYLVVYDDCERPTTTIMIERIYQEHKNRRFAQIIINGDNSLLINGSGPLVFEVCGEREVGKVWGIEVTEKKIHVRVHPGFSFQLQQ